jgi:hypothetical protein
MPEVFPLQLIDNAFEGHGYVHCSQKSPREVLEQELIIKDCDHEEGAQEVEEVVVARGSYDQHQQDVRERCKDAVLSKRRVEQERHEDLYNQG